MNFHFEVHPSRESGPILGSLSILFDNSFLDFFGGILGSLWVDILRINFGLVIKVVLVVLVVLK